MFTSRFSGSGHVRTDDVLEKAGQIEELEDLSRKGRRLVRANGHGHAVILQCLQSRLHILENARLFTADLVVAALEGVDDASRNLIDLERTLEQPLQTFPDE